MVLYAEKREGLTMVWSHSRTSKPTSYSPRAFDVSMLSTADYEIVTGQDTWIARAVHMAAKQNLPFGRRSTKSLRISAPSPRSAVTAKHTSRQTWFLTLAASQGRPLPDTTPVCPHTPRRFLLLPQATTLARAGSDTGGSSWHGSHHGE